MFNQPNTRAHFMGADEMTTIKTYDFIAVNYCGDWTQTVQTE
jgi:hypothetical protein